MGFSTPKKPKVTPAPTTDKEAGGAQDAAAEARRRAAAQKGRQSTIVASGRLGNVG